MSDLQMCIVAVVLLVLVAFCDELWRAWKQRR